MAGEATDHDRLVVIIEQLDKMPATITAAVALGVKPLSDALIDHEGRIKTVETAHNGLEKRLWAIALILFTAFVSISVKLFWP